MRGGASPVSFDRKLQDATGFLFASFFFIFFARLRTAASSLLLCELPGCLRRLTPLLASLSDSDWRYSGDVNMAAFCALFPPALCCLFIFGVGWRVANVEEANLVGVPGQDGCTGSDGEELCWIAETDAGSEWFSVGNRWFCASGEVN